MQKGMEFQVGKGGQEGSENLWRHLQSRPLHVAASPGFRGEHDASAKMH